MNTVIFWASCRYSAHTQNLTLMPHYLTLHKNIASNNVPLLLLLLKTKLGDPSLSGASVTEATYIFKIILV